ncbi:MAG: class I SAM-dependent methyltransferase [Phycisphaerales bacterium]|nr:class I SAM-dependent methyltransferase [Phycisphaerales bacterium]
MNEAPDQPAAAAAHPDRRHAAVRRVARVAFDKWARSYDRSRLNELVFFPTIRLCQEEIYRWQASRGERPFRMLDVGCGTGRLVTLLAGQPGAERLIGLDYSPVMLARASERVERMGLTERVHLVHGDAERLPFADASFDVVTCCHSFHHYPHQAAAVASFRRVLRPGGMLILVDGFRDNVVGWVIFDVVVTGIEKNVYHVPWSELAGMIRGAGFARLTQRKVNVLAPLLVNVAMV